MGMDRDTFRKVVQILTPQVGGEAARSALVTEAWKDAPNLQAQVNYSGPANVFAANLVSTGERFGNVKGRAAVLYLLDYVEMFVSEEKADEIEAIKAALGDPSAAAPATTPTTQPAGGTNLGNVTGKMINIGGTINIYGNADDFQNPPASTASPGKSANGPITRDQVFMSYSHRETEWMKRLMTSLKPRMRFGGISVWNDEHIKVGAQWRKEIDNALAAARVAVMLVSSDFLASSFIMEQEVPVILQAAENSLLTVVWIPLTFSGVKHTPIINYQCAGTPLVGPNTPLISLDAAKQSQVLERIADEIMEVYNHEQTS